MIFVTVGTGEFDELVKQIDSLNIKEKIVIQVGKGKYIPKNYDSFDFSDNLDKYYNEAWLIIGHGGAATIFELLNKNKKFIGVANTNRTDDHQKELLKVFSEKGNLIWCKDINKLGDEIERARSFKFKKYTPPECSIHKKIMEIGDED